jgi:predicted nucleic-acid-binding Zn-ribbon protein
MLDSCIAIVKKHEGGGKKQMKLRFTEEHPVNTCGYDKGQIVELPVEVVADKPAERSCESCEDSDVGCMPTAGSNYCGGYRSKQLTIKGEVLCECGHLLSDHRINEGPTWLECDKCRCKRFVKQQPTAKGDTLSLLEVIERLNNRLIVVEAKLEAK